jgi:hypothetical protein
MAGKDQAGETAGGGVTFQPFGYAFHLRTSLPLSRCQEEIRRRLVPMGKRPSDQRPRGVFIGRFFMLWMVAWDLIDRQSRPKLICRLEQTATGTELRGRVIPGLGLAVGLILYSVLVLGILLYLANKTPPYAVESPLTYTLVKIMLSIVLLAFTAGCWCFQHLLRHDGRPMETWLIRILDAQPVC